MAEKNEPNTEFSIVIVTPDKVLLEDKAKKLTAPGIYQEIAILPDHTPLYAELKKGDVKVVLSNDQDKSIPIERAIMRVKQNKVSVIMGFA